MDYERRTKIIAVIKHIGVVLAGVFILLGLPFFTSDYFHSLGGGTDAVTSASVILDAPSGNYVVFINQNFHTNGEVLKDWEGFFMGGDAIIFEDIVAGVAANDSAGISMAESYQSRLPKNQMDIKIDQSVMILSRLKSGQYDVIVMSEEFAKSYSVKNSCSVNTVVVNVSGDSDEEA